MGKFLPLTASLVLSTALLGLNATPALASTTQSMQLCSIELNGVVINKPYRTVLNNTTYMPIFYVGALLKQLGYNSSWNGLTHTWSISSLTEPQFPLVNGKTGPTTITINGAVVEEGVPTTVLRDPSSHADTTFMPIWFVQQLLNGLGFTPSTDKWQGNLSTPIWALSTNDTSPTGYIYDTSSSADFIQFTKTDNIVNGTWQQAAIDSTGRSVNTSHYSFTGTTDGTSITFNIQNFGSLSGVLSNNGLTLSIPQQDGSLGQFSFAPSTLNVYDSDLAALQSQATSSQDLATTEAQIDDYSQAVSDDQASLNGYISSLVDQATNVPQKEQSVSNAVEAAHQDEVAVLNDVASGVDPTYSALPKLEQDYATIAFGYQNDAPVIQGLQTSVTDTLNALTSDYSDLLTESAKDPSYQPSPAIPSQDSIKSYESQANSSITSANSTLNQFLANFKAAEEQAYGYEQTALAATQH